MTRKIAPKKFLKEMEKVEIAAFTAMYLNHPDKAEHILQKELNQLYIYQEKQQRKIRNFTVHKGGPLHNIGIALAMQNNMKQATRYILAAYMEDIFTTSPEEAKTAPAFRFLNQHEWLHETITEVTQYALELKERDEIPLNPLRELIILDPPEGQIGTPQKTLKGTPENRVFIGGNYSNIALLREISNIVFELNMVPILVADYSPPSPEDIRRTSLEILNQCEWALFEVSFSNGHMMEIEHVLAEDNWHINLLLQIDPTDTRRRPPPSQMLPEQFMTRYNTLGQLRELLLRWFQGPPQP